MTPAQRWILIEMTRSFNNHKEHIHKHKRNVKQSQYAIRVLGREAMGHPNWNCYKCHRTSYRLIKAFFLLELSLKQSI